MYWNEPIAPAAVNGIGQGYGPAFIYSPYSYGSDRTGPLFSNFFSPYDGSQLSPLAGAPQMSPEEIQKQIEELYKKYQEEVARGDFESASQTLSQILMLTQLLGGQNQQQGGQQPPSFGGTPGLDDFQNSLSRPTSGGGGGGASRPQATSEGGGGGAKPRHSSGGGHSSQGKSGGKTASGSGGAPSSAGTSKTSGGSGAAKGGAPAGSPSKGGPSSPSSATSKGGSGTPSGGTSPASAAPTGGGKAPSGGAASTGGTSVGGSAPVSGAGGPGKTGVPQAASPTSAPEAGASSSVPSASSLESEKAQAEKQEEDRKKWTVMFYGSGADKNLDSQMLGQLKGIEGVGALDSVNALVRQSSASGFGIGNEYETKTFAMEDGKLADKTSGEAAGEMSDPKTLTDFLEWGIRNYPAEHYAVVMGGHGAGFLGTLENQKQDELMSPVGVAAAFDKAQTDLRAEGALATDQKIDSVAFDSCYMGQYEVMYQMRDQTKYVIGSPEAIGAEGLDYGRILTDLKSDVNGALDDPKAFAQNVVNSSSDNNSVLTLSAVDAEQLGKVDARFQSLSQSINKLSDSDYNTLVQSISVAQAYGRYDGANPLYRQYYEINDVMNSIKAAPIQDQALKGELFNEASLLQEDMTKSLIASYGNDAYKGAALSMFLPVEKLTFETSLAGYQHLDAFDSVSFLKDSQYPFEIHEAYQAMASPQMGPGPSENIGAPPPPPPVTSESSQWWVNKLVKDVVDQTATQAGVHSEGQTNTEKLAETVATVGKDQLAQNVAQAAGQQFADQVAQATDKNTAGRIAGDITNALAQELTPVLGAQEAKEVATKAAEQIVANTASVNPDSAPEVAKQVVNTVADMTAHDANNQELMAKTVDNIALETWNHTGDLGTAINVSTVAKDAADQKAAEQAMASQASPAPVPEPLLSSLEPAPVASLPAALDPVPALATPTTDAMWSTEEAAGVLTLAANLQAGPGPEGDRPVYFRPDDEIKPVYFRPEEDIKPVYFRPEDEIKPVYFRPEDDFKSSRIA